MPTTNEAMDDSWILSPMQGTVIAINVEVGQEVPEGMTLLIMDSMKMEHEIAARVSGIVSNIHVRVGDTVYEQHPLLSIEAMAISRAAHAIQDDVDLDEIRPDLKEVVERRQTTLDENRPDAVKRRHSKGQRTARENIEHLCDDGTFVEYGKWGGEQTTG